MRLYNVKEVKKKYPPNAKCLYYDWKIWRVVGYMKDGSTDLVVLESHETKRDRARYHVHFVQSFAEIVTMLSKEAENSPNVPILKYKEIDET